MAERPKIACGDTAQLIYTLDTFEKYLLERVRVLEEKVTAVSDLAEEREARNVERFASQKEGVNIAMVASEKAVTKSETAYDKRFEGVNEFREALSDLTSKMLLRTEASALLSGLQEKLEGISAWKEKMEGRGGGFKDSVNWLVMAIGAALGAVVAWLLRGIH